MRDYLLLVCLIVPQFLVAQPLGDLKFVQNKNQWPAHIDFMAKLPGGQMFVKPGGFGFAFFDNRAIDQMHYQSHIGQEVDACITSSQINGHSVHYQFVNANTHSEALPFGRVSEYYNFFLGANEKKWAGEVPAYTGMVYPDVYPGISLKVYSEGTNMKYDWQLMPGANAADIVIDYGGADGLYLENGNLHVNTALGEIVELKPVAYQWVAGTKRLVKCEFELLGNRVSYCLPDGYDACYELIIDPLLIFSTYSGSTADNWGSTATPGENGRLYSAGVTIPLRFGDFFPATPGAYQTTGKGVYDVGILKYDSTGTRLLYATYLGGSQSESAHSLVINDADELWVLGTTSSSNFPTTSAAFDRTYNGGTQVTNMINYDLGSDLFVAKLNKTGSQLLASSFFGGAENDGMNPRSSPLVRNYGDELRGDIIPDGNGNVFVSSVTSSTDFPVFNSFGLTYNGGVTDAVVMKLNSDLSQVVWSAFVGGSLADASHAIQVDSHGDLFVGGGTNSANFPTTLGSYQTTLAGDADGWIAKLKGNGSMILNSTLTGTAQFNQVYFIDLDKNNNLFAYGQTQGAFPITAGKYNNPNSGQFLQKFDNSLTTLEFSTVFGSGVGIPNISPTAFLVNDCDNIFMSGWGGALNGVLGYWPSNTNGMAVTPDAIQTTTSGNDFYFIVLSADASQLLYATYLGGTTSLTHVDGGTSRFDKGGIVYHSVCAGCQAFNGVPKSDFPTTPGAVSRVNRSNNCNNAAFKLDLSTLKARIQTNNVQLTQPGLTKICFPDPIIFQNRSIGGQRFTWSFGDGAKLQKTDTAAIRYNYAQTGTYTVKLVVRDVGTCAGADSTKVNVNVYPVQGVAGPDLVMCYDAGTQLVASGGVTYQWKSKSNSFTSNQATPSINPEATESYFVTITDVNGCVKKDTVNVRVVPGIDLKFTVERVNYSCFNMPSLRLINQADTNEDVFFDLGDGNTSDLPNLVHRYQKGGVYTVKLIGRKESCVYEKQETVQIDSLKVPNIITPALLDGKNDTFQIQYGNAQSRQSLNVSLLIYNRWGSLVYENKNYKDDWAGSEVAPGVYFYEATIEGITSCRGWVQVVK